MGAGFLRIPARDENEDWFVTRKGHEAEQVDRAVSKYDLSW